MKFKLLIFLAVLTLLLLNGCEKKEAKKESAAGMKCGAGKCGANMFDGNLALDKKKKNILSQMRDDDTRKDCVINAPSTKSLYNCIREKDGKKLTTKCGSSKPKPTMKNDGAMKCAAGKCG